MRTVEGDFNQGRKAARQRRRFDLKEKKPL